VAGWRKVEEFMDDLVECIYALEALQAVPPMSDEEFLEMERRLQQAINLEYQKVANSQYIVSDHLNCTDSG